MEEAVDEAVAGGDGCGSMWRTGGGVDGGEGVTGEWRSAGGGGVGWQRWQKATAMERWEESVSMAAMMDLQQSMQMRWWQGRMTAERRPSMRGGRERQSMQDGKVWKRRWEGASKESEGGGEEEEWSGGEGGGKGRWGRWYRSRRMEGGGARDAAVVS